MTLLRRGTRFSWPLIILLTLLSGEILNVQAQEGDDNQRGQQPAQNGQGNDQQDERWMLPDFGNQKPEEGVVKLPNAKIISSSEDLKKYSENQDACSVTSSDNAITLTYDKKAAEKGCSVYLVFGTNMESIDFTANLEAGCKAKLEAAQCKDSDWNNAVEQSSTNSMPFIYSVTGSEIANLKDGPTPGVQCPAAFPHPADDKNCKDKGGEYCMDKTFLEIGWSKCDNKLHALVHPVGEPKAGVGLKEAAESIEVKIESDNTKWFTVGKDAYGLSNPAEGPFCFEPVKKGIPKYWSIEERPGKSILAFHLLPQTARRVHAWKDDNTWAVKEKPKGDPVCLGQLSITFNDVEGVLAEEDLSTTPSTETTTTMPSTTSDETAAPSDGPTTDTPTPGTGSSETTTNGTTTEGTAADGNKPMAPWLIALIVVGALALVAAVGVLIYCLCCRGKGEDDEEEAGEEEEDAEKGEAGDSKKEASGGDE